ncbi:MAG: hypothetical protein WEC75_03475 [Dehalococcoidia bacterium]
MKYPISVPAGGVALRWPWESISLAPAAVAVLGFVLRHWGLLAALAVTVLVHAPTLDYFFEGDDFVVLGSVEYLGPGRYIADSFLMRDIVPNWRPLTAVVYAAEWQAFGLNAGAWRATNLALHLGSMAVLYAIVLRLSARPGIAGGAALIFGISGAHFDTVTYITALPHVLATFLTLCSLLAIVSYARDGERTPAAFVLAFGLFVLAFLANEGAFVYAPVLVGAYALYGVRWRRSPLLLVLHAAPFVALASGWLAFYETCSCEQLKFDGYSWGPHVFDNYALYTSWIVFPARAIPLNPDGLRWFLAGGVTVFGLFYAVRGPHLARLAVLGTALALLPFVPVEIWTASRYTYAAVAFFAPLAALAGYALYDGVRRTRPFVRIPATVLALLFVATAGSLWGWQTYAQNFQGGERADRWELLVNELQRNYESVPPGTTIYISGGPWTNPMEQYTWVPSVARALYGDVAAFSLPAEQYRKNPPDTRNALFLEWTPDGLRPVPAEQLLRAP